MILRSKRELERTEAEILDDKFDEDVADSTMIRLDQAIRDRKSSDERLETLLPGRSAPWLKPCTDEEAVERARILKEEYDRFLHVLFGRDLMSVQAAKKAKETLLASPVKIQSTWSNNLVVPMPMSQQLQYPDDWSKTVDPQSTIIERGGVLPGLSLGDLEVDLDSYVEPAFDFSEWLETEEEKIRNPKAPTDSQSDDLGSRAQGDDLMVRESAIYLQSETKKMSEEELVRDLGLKLEGTELTSNFVEWVDADDWAELNEWDGESAATYTDEEWKLEMSEMEMGFELTSNMVEWGTFDSPAGTTWHGEESESSDDSGMPELIDGSIPESEGEEGSELERERDEKPNGGWTYKESGETPDSSEAAIEVSENLSEVSERLRVLRQVMSTHIDYDSSSDEESGKDEPLAK
ncbi:hypothetical protein P7C70_g5849, partial [Phenoliferia sp. Uapishka_3]